MRRAARVDDNHLEIVEALTKAGASVTSLASVGRGVPDLLVSFRGRWHVLEVKDGRKRPSARRLRPAQFAWMAAQRAPVAVVTTADEALQVVGATGSTGYRGAMGEDV